MERSKFTIRTSDRRVFRRCLRKWDHMSSLRKNLKRRGTETNINFWFGSAIHFALEDYHGYNRFKDPRRALWAYYKAFKESEWPDGAELHYDLGMSMLSYYVTWYEKHNKDLEFRTPWLDANGQEVAPFTEGATPAVEQKFYFELPYQVVADRVTDEIYAVADEANLSRLVENELPQWSGTSDEPTVEYYWPVDDEGTLREVHIVPIYYHGTMDRIVVDKYGRWWILDYKTAKGADTNKLETDDQISAYLWAAEKHFGRKIHGFIYLQLTKEAVQQPRRLKDGTLSTAKGQKTTYSLVRQAIIDDYGSVSAAPSKYVKFLNDMAMTEEPEGDRFIRWDYVYRNRGQIESTYEHILGELQLMLQQELYCFPTPTRDCIWDCPIRDMCIAMDKKDDALVAKLMLDWEKRPRHEDGNADDWVANIPWPKDEQDLIPLEDILQPEVCMNIELDSLTEETTGFKFLFAEEDE